MLVTVAKDKPQLITLCGIKPEETKRDFSNQRLKAGDAVLLAFDLEKNTVLKELKYAATSPSLHRQCPLTSALAAFSQCCPEQHHWRLWC